MRCLLLNIEDRSMVALGKHVGVPPSNGDVWVVHQRKGLPFRPNLAINLKGI